jgi:hypothetical protein
MEISGAECEMLLSLAAQVRESYDRDTSDGLLDAADQGADLADAVRLVLRPKLRTAFDLPPE